MMKMPYQRFVGPIALSVLLSFCLVGCTTSTESSSVSDQAANILNYSETSSSNVSSGKDYYADDNYEFPVGYDTERNGVSHCTIQDEVTYYSSTAGHDKSCTVILPPDYDTGISYPVVYCLHGWGGTITEWEEVITTYENMVADGIAQKAI